MWYFCLVWDRCHKYTLFANPNPSSSYFVQVTKKAKRIIWHESIRMKADFTEKVAEVTASKHEPYPMKHCSCTVVNAQNYIYDMLSWQKPAVLASNYFSSNSL